MGLETNNNKKKMEQDIKRNEERITVLNAKTSKLDSQIQKLENETSLTLRQKTKIHHLKHELKSRSDEIELLNYKIEIARDKLAKME
jgi:hypothetical protein